MPVFAAVFVLWSAISQQLSVADANRQLRVKERDSIRYILQVCGGSFDTWDGAICQASCDLSGKVRFAPWCVESCNTEAKFQTSPCFDNYCGNDVLSELPICDDPDSTIEETLDITYMRAYGVEFKLNLYSDNNITEDQPLALFVHGGSFIGGSKDNNKCKDSSVDLAKQGYRVINIDYPLCKHYWDTTDEDNPIFLSWDVENGIDPNDYSADCVNSVTLENADPPMPPSGHAARIEIANRAIRTAAKYMHENAIEHKVDTTKTVCYGTSAGAISCFDAFLFNTQHIADPFSYHALEPDLELDEIKINVATGRAGAYYPDKYNITFDTVATMPDGAAAWNIIGTDDETVSPVLAQLMNTTLSDFGITSELILVEGGTHGNLPNMAPEMYEFIETNLANA